MSRGGEEVVHKESPPLDPRPTASRWRRSLASAVYRTGCLRVAEKIFRKYEFQFAESSRLPRLRRVTAPKFLILCYHRVGIGGLPLYSELAPELFEAQMLFLRGHYPIVSLSQVYQGLLEKSSVGPAVAVTFDDGYRGVYEHAFPVLRKYQIPATVFLIADSLETGQVAWYDRVFLALQTLPPGNFEIHLGQLRTFQLSSRQSRLCAALEINAHLRGISNQRRQEFCAGLENRVVLPQEELEGRMLDWNEVRIMRRAGIEFGSHSMTHPVMSRLTSAELEFEIVQSKRKLEPKLGTCVQDFAFPFGHPNDCGTQAAAVLARCGYRSAVTTIPGVNAPGTNPFALRRIQVGEEHTVPMLALCLSRYFLRGEPLRPVPPLELNRNLEKHAVAVTQSTEGTRHA